MFDIIKRLFNRTKKKINVSNEVKDLNCEEEQTDLLIYGFRDKPICFESNHCCIDSHRWDIPKKCILCEYYDECTHDWYEDEFDDFEGEQL